MAIVTKILETLTNRGLRIIKVLALGRSAARTGVLIQGFGEDSNPVAWKPIYMETETTGQPVIIGFVNPSVMVSPGEKKIFSTDDTGKESISIYLKNDGTAEIGGTGDNLTRFSDLEAGFNELKTDFNNLVQVVNNIRTDQNTFASVYSPGQGGFPAEYNITSSSANQSDAVITDAKIDELKTSSKT